MAEDFIEDKTPEEIKKSREKVRKARAFELEELKTEEELSEEKKKQLKKQRFFEWILLLLVAASIGILTLFVFVF
jgi:hypothetical protein